MVRLSEINENKFANGNVNGKIYAMTNKELITRRESLGFSRDELARELKTTYTTVYRWEQGERSIPNYLDLALEALEKRKQEAEK